MDTPLSELMETASRQYSFHPRVWVRTTDAQKNLAFLAMLDFYAQKAGVQLPEGGRALDFGCRGMNYADGLATFLGEYDRAGAEKRAVHLVGIEGTPLDSFESRALATACSERKLCPTRLHFLQRWI